MVILINSLRAVLALPLSIDSLANSTPVIKSSDFPATTKAAAEFMRVSGFEELTPIEVESAAKELLPLLGEEESFIQNGITEAATKLANGKDVEKLKTTFSNLLNKIQTIAEKVQNNTSHMIANREFLSQSQVAESVLNLCDDEIARILNGKVIPGDRVFYPVKPHVGTTTPNVHQINFSGKWKT